MAWGAIAAVGISLLGGSRSAKKARKAQEAMNETQRKINKLKNKQSRREFLRGFRQQQAATISGAIAAGVGLESSAFQGQLQSQRAQLGLAMKEGAQQDALGAEFAGYQRAYSSRSAQAQRWGQVGAFASQFIGFANKGDGET